MSRSMNFYHLQKNLTDKLIDAAKNFKAGVF